jgi:hypothetical protein
MEDGRRLGDLHLARPPDALDDRQPAPDSGQRQGGENQDLRLRSPDGSGRHADHLARDSLVGRQRRDLEAPLRDRRDRDRPRRRRAGAVAAAATGRGRRSGRTSRIEGAGGVEATTTPPCALRPTRPGDVSARPRGEKPSLSGGFSPRPRAVPGRS